MARASEEEAEPLHTRRRNSSDEAVSSNTPAPGQRLSHKPRWLALAIALATSVAAVAVATAALASSLSSATAPSSKAAGSHSSHSSKRMLDPEEFTVSGHSVVATDHPQCSHEASLALEYGNAADAAIRAALCLGVHRPTSSGLGGGFFLLFADGNSGNTTFLDARETAPSNVSASLYEEVKDKKSVQGGLSVATPAEGPGLTEVFRRFGSGNVSWLSLVQPAAQAARDGVALDQYTARELNRSRSLRHKLCSTSASVGCKLYMHNGNVDSPKRAGEIIKHEKLAETLDKLAKDMDYMQSEEFAQKLASDVQRNAGNLSVEDIKAYTPKEREPLQTTVDGVQLIAPGPPSSASVAMHALGVLGHLPSAADAALSNHRRAEALKSGFAYRLGLGDPDFHEEAMSIAHKMVQQATMQRAVSNLTDIAAQAQEVYTGLANTTNYVTPPDDSGTSHLTIVDDEGNVAALTSTVNTYFGSGIISESTGLTLNNEMDDFSTGSQSNVYGLPFTEANSVEPQKRPLSSMCPMLVKREGQFRAAAGASGGPRIITGVTEALERHLWRGQEPFDAVAPARVHHQLFPDILQAEHSQHLEGEHVYALSQEAIRGLRARKHVVEETEAAALAVVQMVVSESPSTPQPPKLIGVSDPRKLGKPAATT